MAITPVVLTTGTNTNSSVFVTATYSPSPTRPMMGVVYLRGTTIAPTWEGNGATWVLVQTSTKASNRMSVFRTFTSAPISGASTINVPGAASTVAGTWHVIELTSGARSGTDGSGLIVQSVSSASTGSTKTLHLAPFAATNNLALGFFGVTDTGLTTAGGFAQVARTQFQHTTLLFTVAVLTESRVNDTSIEAVSNNAQWMGIGVEIAEQTGVVQELSGSLSVPVTATGDVQTQHNLGGTASVATTASGTIQLAGHFLSGTATVPITVSQNIVLEHLLQASASAAMQVLGDVSLQRENTFTRTAIDVDFKGQLHIKHRNRQRLRNFVNPSSPRFTQNLTVSTASTSINLLPLQNAAFAILIPASTNTHPYRLAPTTDAANTNGGLLLSGRTPSLVALAPDSTAMHVFTSATTAVPLRVRIL